MQGQYNLCYDCEKACDIMVLLLTLSGRKEMTVLQNFLDFVFSIIASVIAYYICKWLDGED